MPRIFITAFEPYDCWKENSSWLALVEFTKDLSSGAQITTRLYPVDFSAVRERLEKDLAENYDYAIHLGQAPGSASVRLEAIGLNIGGNSQHPPEQFQPLVNDGPVAYRSALPLGHWVATLRGAGIPALLSYHAGTYLCNAALYFTHYCADTMGLKTQAAFVHLPLDPSQTASAPNEMAALPVSMSAAALRLIVQELVKREPPRDPKLA